ncbi:TraR/DksA C4-type zinc finger protein [Alisedimentitalea sp. MJ-SS2]|uniref:TraR/DksA family transcriptional regulator n=1 Tax=Aliisedimentitalea sp. MJ-SS2 TaxID=3049795 RepID=UPI0029159A8C|nr:TraR/DksA C4-type zinc finger protein [Alisedimentitalea sp. MJ-SS2]MDU8926439.1 TraR/DksA C4-type zinc finger protein [Alisedimentitalea sp. MJ-SS2]
MNNAELSRFRQLIETRLAELRNENTLGQDGQKTVELDQQSVGRLSRMDALQNQAMARATQARRDAEDSCLRAALTRMDEDEFGYCEDCGEEIAPGRLAFDPAVTRCISCASG